MIVIPFLAKEIYIKSLNFTQKHFFRKSATIVLSTNYYFNGPLQNWCYFFKNPHGDAHHYGLYVNLIEK
jgi:hypothetical protein